MSSFVEKMEDVSRKILARMERVAGNEQATKESLIKPFFNALGYDTEDPDCWKPEYNADFPGKKRSEKVDYAILKSANPVVLIEAKPYTLSETALQSRDGQLARYFNTTPTAKLSIITNGVVFRFFTDLVRENIQDEEPFYTFDCRSATKSDFEVLEMFSPAKFNVEEIRNWADDRRNNDKVRTFLASIITEPEKSIDFVKFVIDMTYSGTKSKSVVESFSKKIPGLMRETLDSCIRQRLGLNQRNDQSTNGQTHKAADSGPMTTIEELNVFSAIKGILAGAGKPTGGILHKDCTKWFNVSNQRSGNWFVRLYFNENPKYMVIRVPFNQYESIIDPVFQPSLKAAGTMVTLGDDLEIASLAKVICAAFEGIENSKHQDSETEENDQDVRKVG